MNKHGNKKCLLHYRDGEPPALLVDFLPIRAPRPPFGDYKLVCKNCGDEVDYDEIAEINSIRAARLRSSIRRASD